MKETAVIIRTRNEERWLGVTLKKLFAQTYTDLEVIVVDSGSTDRTLVIAGQFPVRIVTMPYAEFSYPHAWNVGIEQADTQRYIVLLSAHSIPISNTWLQDGIDDLRANERAMGVYGYIRPLPSASFWDKVIVGGMYWWRTRVKGERKMIVRQAGMGVLGATNAIIRKELWDQHHFDEAYGMGGEDGEWAAYWFVRGYIAIKDDRFTVHHSHNLSLRGHLRQRKYWQSLDQPQPFHRLEFRDDPVHKKGTPHPL